MIVIDANIGAGKTTLIRSLHKWERISSSIPIVEENVTEWGPYLEEFYKDMHKNALLFQMKVLEHHLSTKPNDMNTLQIHERSPLSCIEIFGKCLEQDGHLGKLDMELMRNYNKIFGWTPKYIIYIRTPPDVCYMRIQRRNRQGENTIPLEYLVQLHALYEDLYINQASTHGWTVYIVNGNQCVKEVENDVIRILDLIRIGHYVQGQKK